MWIWKKFWNTDIIGKTYIFIILFIVIVTIMCLVTRTKKENLQETINNNTVNEVAVSNDNIEIDYTQNQENETEQKIVNEEKIETTELKETQKIADKKEIIDTVTNVKQAESKTNNKVKEQENTAEEKTSDEEVAIEEKTEIKEQEEQPNQTQEIVRKVKKNDTYIQKIKNYIENHESEKMIKYGYDIQIDSNIISDTSGFTYSEFNMSGLIGRSGTYKIYAQDYYVNGQYVETRCYVY